MFQHEPEKELLIRNPTYKNEYLFLKEITAINRNTPENKFNAFKVFYNKSKKRFHINDIYKIDVTGLETVSSNETTFALRWHIPLLKAPKPWTVEDALFDNNPSEVKKSIRKMVYKTAIPFELIYNPFLKYKGNDRKTIDTQIKGAQNNGARLFVAIYPSFNLNDLKNIEVKCLKATKLLNFYELLSRLYPLYFKFKNKAGTSQKPRNRKTDNLYHDLVLWNIITLIKYIKEADEPKIKELYCLTDEDFKAHTDEISFESIVNQFKADSLTTIYGYISDYLTRSENANNEAVAKAYKRMNERIIKLTP
jgi:hypothetical protein